jgi:putative ABC transport system ATP-binding protein
MIETRSLSKVYDLGKTKVEALREVSLRIERGDFVSIVGPSGSGKTTLLNIVGLLDRATAGEVLIDERNVEGLPAKELSKIRGSRIGFIFQSFNLVPVFTVYENIEMSLTLSDSAGPKKEWKARILKAIDEVGLSEYAQHKPNELSGGQRQRVAIARALVKKPEIIIADEPTANLDSKTAFSIIELMQRLNADEGSTFIFSTHDDRVLKYVRRIIRIEDGRLHE